jgi:hypothetical protein
LGALSLSPAWVEDARANVARVRQRMRFFISMELVIGAEAAP